MTLAKGPDPIKPMITFDNYVIPETVKEVRRPARRPATASPVGIYFSNKPKSAPRPLRLRTGAIVLGTFLLGVLSALYFAKAPQQVADAGVVLPVASPESVPEQNVMQPVADEPVEVAAAPEPAPAGPSPAALAQAVSASLQQDVTRQQPIDLITPAGASGTSDLSAVSLAEILLGLTPQRAAIDQSTLQQPQQQGSAYLQRDVLDTLRESVLAGNYTVKTVERNGVERLCLRVPGADVSQDVAADLLRAAAARGEIELPEAVATSDGDFDADTLIFNLVQTTLSNDGTEAGARAAREMSRRAFIASNAKTNDDQGTRVYIVQPGDSLAYLSLQFYGQPSAYPRIYEANRAILRSPDYIQVGQRLIIPG